MGTGNFKKGLLFLLVTFLFLTCNRKPDEAVVVESIFNVAPTVGLTTTRFEFDATQTMLTSNEDHPVLIRYDWQNDGIWDQDYTTNTKITHRFYKPGTYTIKMEARNLSGTRDTSLVTLIVDRGYSPPVPFFAISPDSANRYTLFSFDAGKSYDDEDSSDLLVFRWDFDGDGNWDTDYGHEKLVNHQYQITGKYQAGLEVMDPTNRSAVIRKMVTVDLLNDSIRPAFTFDGGFSTVEDVFSFDASGSEFLGQPDRKLTYSWDISSDGLWEALNLTTPYFKTVIKREGFVKVKLRVTDDRGLYMDTIQKVQVFPLNSTPVAVLVVGNKIGNLQTDYYFNALNSSDRETSILDLKYQWDLDGDGVWDSEFNNLREITYRFNTLGKHLVKLKVTDANEDFDLKSDTVSVFAGTHETGLLVDRRRIPSDYYSTVKIGNLWWMQENLRIYIEPSKDNPNGIRRLCYGNDDNLCEQYGGIYQYGPAIHACPAGWRLPTKAEFQELVTQEASESLAKLLLGGSSEMHVRLTGYVDIKGKSTGYGTATHFWLSDLTNSGIPNAWYIDKVKGESKPVLTSKTYGYSVRCVKE